MTCYDCGNEMVSNPCRCGAAWIPEERLREMADEIKGIPVELAWKPRAGTSRPCAQCQGPMVTVTLLGIELDRCPAHGVWLDHGELAAVLEHAGELPDKQLIGPDVKLPRRWDDGRIPRQHGHAFASDDGILDAIDAIAGADAEPQLDERETQLAQRQKELHYLAKLRAKGKL